LLLSGVGRVEHVKPDKSVTMQTVEMTGTLPQTNALLSATFDDAKEMLAHDDLDLTYDANGNLTYIFDNATPKVTIPIPGMFETGWLG